jgi:hypothetical protein
MIQRPPIPSHIKRKVRQRCGFGCVICGLPIYEYDHIPGYGRVKRHRAEEITLLCPHHHAEKTKGLLPAARVSGADKDPFNLKQGVTSPYSFWFEAGAPEIVLGTQLFTCNDMRRPTLMAPVVVHRHIPFAFTLDTRGLMLNLDARDSHNKRVLLIRDSELIVPAASWDVAFVGTNLSIWEKSRDLSLCLQISPPHRITLTRYHINVAGITIDIDPTKVELEGHGIPRFAVTGNGTVSANIGILLGDAPVGLSVGIKAFGGH